MHFYFYVFICFILFSSCVQKQGSRKDFLNKKEVTEDVSKLSRYLSQAHVLKKHTVFSSQLKEDIKELGSLASTVKSKTDFCNIVLKSFNQKFYHYQIKNTDCSSLTEFDSCTTNYPQVSIKKNYINFEISSFHNHFFDKFQDQLNMINQRRGTLPLVINLRGNCGGSISFTLTVLNSLFQKTPKGLRITPDIYKYNFPYKEHFALENKFTMNMAASYMKSLKNLDEEDFYKKKSLKLEKNNIEFEKVLNHFKKTKINDLPWGGVPVYLVVDANCYSACQLFVNSLRKYSNVKVVGMSYKEYPLLLNSTFVELEHSGIQFYIPSIMYTSSDKFRINIPFKLDIHFKSWRELRALKVSL